MVACERACTRQGTVQLPEGNNFTDANMRAPLLRRGSRAMPSALSVSEFASETNEENTSGSEEPAAMSVAPAAAPVAEA